MLRVNAIPAHIPAHYKMETFYGSERDCFAALAIGLGVETAHIVARMVNYSPVSVVVGPETIKAELLHAKLVVKARTDSIILERVRMLWERDETSGRFIQSGVIRTVLENRTHHKTDRGFEKAAAELIADHLNARLNGENGTPENTSTLGYVADITNQPAYSVNGTEKIPAFSETGEKNPNAAKSKSHKKSKRRHGRGRH